MEITLSLYVQCFIAGCLGIIFHLLAVKMPSVETRAKAANLEFSTLGYLKDDWKAIAASFMTVLIAVFALDELVGYKPEILSWMKWFFIAIGFMGSSLLIALLGKASKAINSVVDIKTNELDEIKKSE